ncbi:helix-turn-helix transcriptional regulator [Bdellovibrionota bacterium FG-1]
MQNTKPNRYPGPKILVSRSGDMKRTFIELTNSLVNVRITITSRLSARHRRTFALSFLRLFRPWVERHFRASLVHEAPIIDFQKSEDQGIPLFSSASDGDALHRGYELRMRRLDLGLTLRDLARASGVGISHLSDLERGLFNPRPLTLRRIDNALLDFRTNPKIN